MSKKQNINKGTRTEKERFEYTSKEKVKRKSDIYTHTHTHMNKSKTYIKAITRAETNIMLVNIFGGTEKHRGTS